MGAGAGDGAGDGGGDRREERTAVPAPALSPAPRSGIRRPEDLDVFRIAHAATKRVYELTASFPTSERYGLSSQLRRSAASIGANLVEGAARLTTADYRRFVGMARGSAAEVTYHLMLARDLGYISQQAYAELDPQFRQVARMLTGLARSLS